MVLAGSRAWGKAGGGTETESAIAVAVGMMPKPTPTCARGDVAIATELTAAGMQSDCEWPPPRRADRLGREGTATATAEEVEEEMAVAVAAVQ